jgi:hypothetical protein
MKIDTQSLQAELTSAGVPLAERGSFMSIGLARAIAYRLPLPAAPVADPREFYVESCQPTVQQMAGAANETCVVDIDAITELTYQLWFFRYQVCHVGGRDESVAQVMDGMVRGNANVAPAIAEAVVSTENMKFNALAAHVIGKAIKE